MACPRSSDPAWKVGMLMLKICVRLFAAHREIIGASELSVSLTEGATVGTLWELLVAEYPRLAGYSGRLLYAVNQEFAGLVSELHDGDEVAFIPPVSGGRPDTDGRCRR